MMNDWKPMKDAPKDGTMILITETPNGESYNVFPACYMKAHGNPTLEGWWGAGRTSIPPIHLMKEFPNEEQGVVGYRLIFCTPLCWQPMPAMEDETKLRRRAGQIYRQTQKEKHDE